MAQAAGYRHLDKPMASVNTPFQPACTTRYKLFLTKATPALALAAEDLQARTPHLNQCTYQKAVRQD